MLHVMESAQPVLVSVPEQNGNARMPVPCPISPEELDQCLEVVAACVDGTERAHLEAIAARIRAKTTEAVGLLNEARAALDDVALAGDKGQWAITRIENRAAGTAECARTVQKLVASYGKLQARIAGRQQTSAQ